MQILSTNSFVSTEQNQTQEHQPKLIDRLRVALRSRHYSRRTEQAYCQWIKRFIYFHNVRHPDEMAEPGINAFLTHLAINERVSASTQNQAVNAFFFLIRRLFKEISIPKMKRRSRCLTF